jgi:hypothetical protein
MGLRLIRRRRKGDCGTDRPAAGFPFMTRGTHYWMKDAAAGLALLTFIASMIGLSAIAA